MVKYYAVRHKDRNILKKSRSGGFFTLVSDFVLERNGIVYACKLNEELKVIVARRHQVSTDDYTYFKKAQGAVENGLAWLEENQGRDQDH